MTIIARERGTEDHEIERTLLQSRLDLFAPGCRRDLMAGLFHGCGLRGGYFGITLAVQNLELE